MKRLCGCIDAGRLETIKRNTSSLAAYSYDDGGNLTAWGASTGWQYLHNRLTEVPSKGYEFYYTDNGERAAWFQTPTMPDGAGYRLRADASRRHRPQASNRKGEARRISSAEYNVALSNYPFIASWSNFWVEGDGEASRERSSASDVR